MSKLQFLDDELVTAEVWNIWKGEIFLPLIVPNDILLNLPAVYHPFGWTMLGSISVNLSSL